jgi:hypothetical protein
VRRRWAGRDERPGDQLAGFAGDEAGDGDDVALDVEPLPELELEDELDPVEDDPLDELDPDPDPDPDPESDELEALEESDDVELAAVLAAVLLDPPRLSVL